MATMKLIPSQYAVSNTSYLSVTDENNMYTDTSSSTYAKIDHQYKTSSAGYLYVRNFNFSDIPTDAIISSWTVKIKGEHNSCSTSGVQPSIVNGTSVIANTAASDYFGTSATILTIPTGALTWTQIQNTYGSSFGVRIPVKRGNKNKESYIYVYGVELEITYTIPAAYFVKQNGIWKKASNFYIKQNGTWIDQSNIDYLTDSNILYLKQGS